MKKNTRAIAACGILGAIGFILMVLEFPLPFLIPEFIKFDISELPALIASFAFGPLYGVIVCLIKNLLHLFITSTGGIGELSNFILGAIFVIPAGFIYKHKKDRNGALIGCTLGSFLMATISVFTNYFLVYPAFATVLGFPIPAIVSAYSSLLPSANSLFKALVIFNLPFNFMKGFIVTGICFLIYKKISYILKTKN